MAVWVPISGGFAADMGPYIGPWPLLPPGEMTGLSSSAELDFFIALPNPADPTNPVVVADNSYDTPYWDAYRYFTTAPDTGFGYYGGTAGSTPSVPPTPPSGAHLYLFAYDGAVPPNPPEFYVPATYAAGGSAAFETSMGHWSTDQASYDTPKTAFIINLVDAKKALSHPVSAADQNVPTEINTMIATILASDPATATDSTFNEISAVKDPDGDPQSTTGVGVEVLIASFDGTAALASGPDHPTPPGTEGVDWEYSPYIDASGSSNYFQFTGSASWDWGDGTTTFVPAGIDAVSQEEFEPQLDAPPVWGLPPDADNTPLGLEARAAWEAGDTTGSPEWTSSGTVIGDFAPVDEGGITLSPPNLVFDYSPVTDLAFTLHVAPKFLYDGSVDGLTDFAMPGSGHISSFRDKMVFFPGNPRLLIHSGPWQYWVPGAIVPSGLAWRPFIAGAFDTGSGSTLYINTPGLGLVPVMDGPG